MLFELVNGTVGSIRRFGSTLVGVVAAFAIALVMACAPVEGNVVVDAADEEAETVILETETPSAGKLVERHTGYYYPPITSRERYESRDRRIGFVTAITRQQLTFGYSPRYTMFAKGDEAEKLIIVALGDQSIATIYQARALLA